MHIIVSGLANGGSRPKDRTDSERQALREDRKWGLSFQKWHKIKKKMSFGFKHDLFSFALMILFAFHAKNTAFFKCFPKKGKELNHSSAPNPLFHAFGSGVYAPLPLAPTPWKRCLSSFILTLYKLKKNIISIIIICLPSWSTVYTVYVICVVLNCFGPRVWTASTNKILTHKNKEQ